MLVGLCGYVFLIKNKYPYLSKQCKDYIVDATPDFIIECTDEEILSEKDYKEEGVPFSYGIAESLAVYRKICSILATKKVFLMHSAVIDYNGKGIAFLAHSGVGKTTHVKNWLVEFKDTVKIVNGDKPLIKREEDGFYAYGTPWAGKEHYNINTKTKLHAICFLERGIENSCKEVDATCVCEKMFSQVYLPDGEEQTVCVMENMDGLLKSARIFKLQCNKESESAIICKRVIIGE